MRVSSRSVILAGAVLFLGTPAMAALTSSGLKGDCVDCHTMHNSVEGAPVALHGTSSTPSWDPNQNLLKMDCIACHANPNETSMIASPTGGSAIPQVNHQGSKDLAGGNFINLADGFRKGHNVVELGYGTDSNGSAWGSADGLSTPPGMYSTGRHVTGERFVEGGGFLTQFTCAGSAGCHGIRNRALTDAIDDNTTSGVNGNVSGEDGADFYIGDGSEAVRIEGIAAISGAHHNSYDGVKKPVDSDTERAAEVAGGQYVADSYRFIPGLMGQGNTTSDTDRWQNVSGASHNEYYGKGGVDQLSGCGACHGGKGITLLDEASTEGFMKVPNQTISGFCSTCHGMFHSPGTSSKNGSSGAFLRHPNDYVLPTTGEYSNYTSYNITAPVARPALTGNAGDQTAASSTVAPGTDVVMCLSCHVAHASEYDGMLRFDYDTMTAGGYDKAGAAAAGGCFACHTTKGVLPGDR